MLHLLQPLRLIRCLTSKALNFYEHLTQTCLIQIIQSKDVQGPLHTFGDWISISFINFFLYMIKRHCRQARI